MTPYISVIVPTTRVGGLDILFSGLEAQTFKDFELILIDSLYEYRRDLVIAKSLEYSFKITHLPQSITATDQSTALNDGVIRASGYLAYIIPDYTWVKSDCLQIHADFHKQTSHERKYAMVGHFHDCALPTLHKDFYRTYGVDVPFLVDEIPSKFLIKEREVYNHYIDDVVSGKLDALMWSLFETPFTTATDPSSFAVSISKAIPPQGDIDSKLRALKNESYVMETVLDVNGFNEDMNGSHGWQDWEFADRVLALTDTYLYHIPDAIVFTINPRPILSARLRTREVFANEGVWKDGVKSNFQYPVNNRSLREQRKKK
jgi:glycosyltransferase involved in cell wall biosynthesis